MSEVRRVVANERVREGGRKEASKSDWVSKGWKYAIERVREVGARQASQEGKKQEKSEQPSVSGKQEESKRVTE